MHASIYASIEYVLECLREARVVTHRLRQSGDQTVHGEVKVIGPKEEIQRLRRSGTKATMRRWIFGMRRGDD